VAVPRTEHEFGEIGRGVAGAFVELAFVLDAEGVEVEVVEAVAEVLSLPKNHN
jgi:hypothetical protein